MKAAKKLTEKQIEHRERVEDFKASNPIAICSMHLVNLTNTYGLNTLIETIELMGLSENKAKKQTRRRA